MKKICLSLLLIGLSCSWVTARVDEDADLIKKASASVSKTVEKALSQPELQRIHPEGTKAILYLKILPDNKLQILDISCDNSQVIDYIKRKIQGLQVNDVNDFSGRFFKVPVEFRE